MSTSPTGSSKDNSTDFFRQLSQQKEDSPPPVPEQSRVKTGLILGALLGLVYGLITQTINSIYLPGVPLALYPFGPVGNMIASVVVWSGIGALVAWPASAITGGVLGCLCAGAIPVLRVLTTQPIAGSPFDQVATLSMNLLAIGIFALLCVPIMLLVRWAVEVQGELALRPLWSWRRLRAPLAAMLLLGIVTGIFTLYTEDVRRSMTRIHALIEIGLTASRADELPLAFRSNQVDNFLANATRSYTLEQSFDANLRHDVSPIIDTNFATGPLLLARFANGWLLACLVNPQTYDVRCQSYTALPD